MYTLQVVGGSVGQVSFPQFKAFNQLLGNLDIMEKIVNEALKSNPNGYVTKGVCVCTRVCVHVCVGVCHRPLHTCTSVYQAIQISVHFYCNSIAKLSWLCDYVHSYSNLFVFC